MRPLSQLPPNGYRPIPGGNYGRALVLSASPQELTRWRNSVGPPDAAWSHPHAVGPPDAAWSHPGKHEAQPRHAGVQPAPVTRPRAPSVSGLDILQFSSAIYIVEEEEKVMRVDVMRLGQMRGRVSCKYSTVDGSAKAPSKYAACSGEIVMEEGETDKSFDVEIVDDEYWSPVLEFRVQLSEPQNCSLGIYLHTARVKIVDNDLFPSNRYKEEIECGEAGIDSIGGFALFWEYCKLVFTNPGMRIRTTATIVLDQWHNVHYFFTLFIDIYLVDTLFQDPEERQDTLFLPTREGTAKLIGLSYFSLFFVRFLVDYIKIMMDVDGRIRSLLQCYLFSKYLNYSEASRLQVRRSEMQMAIRDDIVGIARAYSTLLEVVQIIGKLLGSICFVMVFMGSSFIGTLALFGMPVAMMIFGYLRNPMTTEARDNTQDKWTGIVQLTQDVCMHYRLVADYMQRPQMNELFEVVTGEQNRAAIPEKAIKLMNNYFPRFLGALCIGAYIIIESPQVFSGETRLGRFLATIKIFDTVSNDSGAVYTLFMGLTEQFSALRTLTKYFNMSAELLEVKAINQNRRESTKRARQEVLKQKADDSVEFKSDMIRMRLDRVGWKYNSRPIFENVSVDVPQGKLVALVGQHQSGKSTLLRLIGHTIFPQAGSIFVPSHLRILHVSQEPQLLSLSAWRNLTFGCPKPITTQDIDRILEILNIFDMEEMKELVQSDLDKQHSSGAASSDGPVERMQTERTEVSVDCCASWQQGPDTPEPDAEDVTNEDWQQNLTHSEKAKIHLARAFIMNPEVLVLQRPLHHFNREVGDRLLHIVREHVHNRGLCLPEEGMKRRRPRTVFFSPETKEQAKEADVIWQLDKLQHTVYEIQADKLVENFTPYQQQRTGTAMPHTSHSSAGWPWRGQQACTLPRTTS